MGAGVPEGVREVYFSCWSLKMLLLFWLMLSVGRYWVPCPLGVLGELELAVWGGLEAGVHAVGRGSGAGAASAGGGAGAAFLAGAGGWVPKDGWTRLVR